MIQSNTAAQTPQQNVTIIPITNPPTNRLPMKRILITLALLFIAIPALASTVTVSGNIRTPDGKLFNGSVRMTLSYPATDTTSGQLVTPQTVSFKIQNGAVQTGAKIVPNDQMAPSNTFYVTQFFTSAGAMVRQNNFVVPSQGIDLGTATPTALTSSNISFDLSSITADTCDVAGVRYINTGCFSGSDTGAKINAAYAALPSKGGRIRIPASASCYTFSTTINFTTLNKPVYLEGEPGDGVCLQYTGSGTAINFDWGITQHVSGGIREIRLLGPNRAGSTVGVSTGIAAGNAAEMWLLENVKIEGFGVGVLTPIANSFLGEIRSSAIIDNGVQYKSTANVENTKFIGVTFGSTTSTSADGILISGNGDYHFTDCSFDNAQIHVTGVSAIVSIVGGHFENIASVGSMVTYNFINWASNNTLTVVGANILQDVASGTWPSYINATGAGTITLSGTQDFTAITVTSLVAAANTVNVNIYSHTISGGNIANAITGATTGKKQLMPDPVTAGLVYLDTLKVKGKTTFADAANFYADLTSGNPSFSFDTNDYFAYDTTNNRWQWFIGGTEFQRLDTTGLTIGLGGSPIAKYVRTTIAQDFGAITANTCTDSADVTVTGALTSDTVIITPPADFLTTACGGVSACLQVSGYVSSADHVKTRVCNVSATNSSDPASATMIINLIR
jgi:hypothetical protein